VKGWDGSDSARQKQLREIFQKALDAAPEERALVLDACCGSDPELKREVRELLGAHVDADDVLWSLARRTRGPVSQAGGGFFAEGRRLGAYRLLRPIGEGGMGAVYLAERADGEFRKQVAVKLLPIGLNTEAARKRFLAERQILAQLEHPGIAHLLDAGISEDGTPFFVMEYVEGEPIDRYCDRRNTGIADRVELFLQVCAAVSYAHEAHVVHRDLKPANILVTSDGAIKLLDFGIAKVLDGTTGSASTLTQWGGSPLTPSYASPEQMSGEAIAVTSDVYQLGVLLYRLVTGRAPYAVDGCTTADARRVIIEDAPAPPGQAEDLDRVVLKALRKEPERRYASVAEFAADVARQRDGVSVMARRESWVLRTGRLGLRSRGVRAAVGPVLVLALAGGVGVLQANRPAAADEASEPAPEWRDQSGNTFVSTASLVALRFYQEGVSAYYKGMPSIAHRLFGAAVREDSTFAMARYYLGRTVPNGRDRYAHIVRARELAQHASERERLLIGAVWAEWMSDPSLRALADTLAARYPDVVDGHYLLGAANVREGEHLAALAHFERVIVMDSASVDSDAVPCRRCDALSAMVHAYVDADSLQAAERTARRWIRLEPRSALAWQELAWTLWRQERGEEAIAARLESAQRRATSAHDQIYPAVVAIRLGDYAAADALLAERLRNGTPAVQREALWWQTISFRYQGRLGEALGSARRFSGLVESGIENPAAWQKVALEAQVLFESGRFRESAALSEWAAAEDYGGLSETRDARHRLWVLTHSASAAMAAGDTARVRMLADTVEALGRGSGYGRDHRLPDYARGLLLAHHGDREGAVTAYRTAIVGHSFARASLELARLLTEMGRPEEAVGVLQVALRGPIAAGGFHVTRPELHAQLGRAWETAGRPDSATFHYARAAAAWRHADPEFDARRDDVQRRLAALR
jgi:tetratricopeptide (TPR) repeat protein/predicted Ser/Thr protein kinase